MFYGALRSITLRLLVCLVIFATFALLGLLAGAHARFASRTTERRADKAADPPIPTSTLITDFQKDGVNSSWAEGHPKIWAAAAVDFKGPAVVDVSADEKFIVVASGRNVTIRDTSTQEIVSSALTDASGSANTISIFPDVDEGYSVFVATLDTTSNKVTRFCFSSDGAVVGEQTQYDGLLSTFDGRRGPFSEDGRRLLLADRSVRQLTIYDVDNPDSNVVLTGHTDRLVSAAFSPDGALVSTASWDQSMKLWNASTGELVHSFGPSGGQNWKTNFSPDGKYVVLGTSAAKGTVNIWSVANVTAPPIVISNFGNWVRTASWTSDSKFIAAGTYGIVQVYSMDEQKVIQRWQTEDPRFESWELFWIEGESGLKLAYRITAGLEVYDFESNLKYRWGPHAYAQYNGGGSGDDTTLIKSRGWIGGSDADADVRFYDFAI
ncbi:unnamed protein product [Clonostachys rosea f. rosea IK726]|uniref:Uncharacterized protein n=1 Tax=Clonostachys rosea f. rosea IK726 TaxID=1349383 RepID=A0ACA9U511_BIOOC|nr:unnamed protein product [Clonostachys rosea f. rosea IK726]